MTTTILNKERLSRKFKEVFEHAVQLDALRLWRENLAAQQIQKEQCQTRAAEGKAADAVRQAKQVEEQSQIKNDKLKESFVQSRTKCLLRAVTVGWHRHAARLKWAREAEKLRRECDRAKACEISKLEGLFKKYVDRSAKRFFKQKITEELSSCFAIWLHSTAEEKWSIRERAVQRRADVEMLILKEHMLFLRDQSFGMFVRGRSMLDMLDMKTILTEWYVYDLRLKLGRSHKEATYALRSQANRSVVDADHRAFLIGQATSKAMGHYKDVRLVMRCIFYWNRFATRAAADRREENRVKQVSRSVFHAEQEKVGAVANAAYLASSGMQRRHDAKLLTSCINLWFTNMVSSRLQRMHAEQWRHHGTLMEKVWDRVEKATTSMSWYCVRQSRLVAAQRCLCAWIYSTRVVALQDDAFQRHMEAERTFEDDAGQMVSIYHKRINMQGLKVMMHRIAWQDMFNAKLQLLKWRVCAQLQKAAAFEEQERVDHEDQLAQIIRVHSEDRRCLRQGLQQQCLINVDLRWKQRFFTAWQNLKPLRHKTAMLEFLGVTDEKQQLTFNTRVHEVMIENLTSHFAQISDKRARADLWYRIFVNWRDVAEVSKFQRHVEEKSKKQHTAYISLRDDMRLKVDATREHYQEQFEKVEKQAMLSLMFGRWWFETLIARVRRLSRNEVKTREAHFDDNLIVIESDYNMKLRDKAFHFSHVVHCSRSYMLLYLCWHGWRFLRTLEYVDMLKVDIASMRDKHHEDVATIQGQTVRYLTAYANNGWRFHRKVKVRWKFFFQWRRVTMVFPERHEEILVGVRSAMRHRKNLAISYLIGHSSRHTSGIFSDMYHNLFLILVVGRWALMTAEARATKTVEQVKKHGENILARDQGQMFAAAFSCVEAISDKYVRHLEVIDRRCLFMGWRNVAACAEEVKLQAGVNKLRIKEVEETMALTRYRRGKLAESLMASGLARRKMERQRACIVYWRFTLMQVKILDLSMKVRGLTTDLKHADETFDKRLATALEEHTHYAVSTIARLMGNYADMRGDRFLLCYLVDIWATTSLMRRERAKMEDERARLLAEHRFELARWKELEAMQRSKADVLDESVERMAVLSYDSQMLVGLHKFFGIWRISAFLSSGARNRTEDLQKMEALFAEDVRRKTANAQSKEERAKQKAAEGLDTAQQRRKLRLCVVFWHRMMQHHRYKAHLATEEKAHEKAIKNLTVEYDIELRSLRGELTDKRKELAAWIKVARTSAVLERCTVAWRMQVRIIRLESYVETLSKEFEARLQQESLARTHAEAEARHQRQDLAVQLKQSPLLQTGEDSDIDHGFGRSAGVTSIPQGRSATRPAPSKGTVATAPAEQMLAALRRASSRNLVAALLALLTHEPRNDEWRRRRGREASMVCGGGAGFATTVVPVRPMSPPGFTAESGFAWDHGEEVLPEGIVEAADSLGRRALEKLAQVRQALAVPDEPLPYFGAGDAFGGFGFGFPAGGPPAGVFASGACPGGTALWQDVAHNSTAAATEAGVRTDFGHFNLNVDGIIVSEGFRDVGRGYVGSARREELHEASPVVRSLSPTSDTSSRRFRLEAQDTQTWSAVRPPLERPQWHGSEPDPNRSSMVPHLELEAQLESLQRSLDAMERPLHERVGD